MATAVVSVVCVAAWVAAAVPPDVEHLPRPGPSKTDPAQPERAPRKADPIDSQPRRDAGADAGDATAARDGAGGSVRAGGGSAAVPWPHAMLSEVLYAVPGGNAGDANLDGARQVSGDEFVEIVNPHDRAIQLEGCVLTDGTTGTSQFRFVFPAFELPPGGVAVVFNGHETAMSGGAVGDARSAPSAPDARFNGAWVFTAGIAAQRTAFSNDGDWVLLTAADGTPVHRVAWGSMSPPPALAAGNALLLDETAPAQSGASVQRDGPDDKGAFRDHRSVTTGAPTRLFGPGWLPKSAPGATVKPAAKPEEETTPDP